MISILYDEFHENFQFEIFFRLLTSWNLLYVKIAYSNENFNDSIRIERALFKKILDERTGPHKTTNRPTDFFKNFRSRNDI